MNINMSWTERQGQVGDLTKHSKQDLQELLLRQEKILSNTRLIQTLPDKGEKIKEFAVKIQQALKHHEEAEIKQKLVSEARMGFQSKYQQAFTMQQRPAQNTFSAGDPTQVCFFSSSGKSAETTDKTHAPETELVEAMERVTLSNGSSGDSNQHQRRSIENYFMNTPAKPHYLNVIEKSENIQSSRKSKFKTNHFTPFLGSSSPSQSSRTSSPLSAQARRERDRKHLDDITAAKLPPLHNSPAQLLSLEESAILLKQQTKKQQELQAKLAAQKLSEGLKISMGSYTPDGGPMAAYREVHDEGAQLSSEED
uniref:Uncharacterized protein n=1 Tax=Periophthalmus magnuspinnatus TaxID=409849 RepID=A0A3B3ZRP1_9GOBI